LVAAGDDFEEYTHELAHTFVGQVVRDKGHPLRVGLLTWGHYLRTGSEATR
jgi:hypothetical protein